MVKQRAQSLYMVMGGRAHRVMTDTNSIDDVRLTCSSEETEAWRKRAAEVAKAGERPGVAELCPDCYGVIPFETTVPESQWPGVKYCECGHVTTQESVMAIVGISSPRLGGVQAFPRKGVTDGR
jgi:hypothetical protein